MTSADPATAVVCLLGPTASGKTSAALALAARRRIEIISMDSALVYRGMDIGTAKPTLAERAGTRHHLIDLIEPTDSYSAARFARDARRLIGEIIARGNTPLVVGGTMLYYKALCDGLNQLATADPVLRAQLDQDAALHGWPAMHARLAELDPITAARLPPNDSQRIQRALEVCLLHGEPLSTLLAAPRHRSEIDPYRFEAISLEPSDRAVLHRRIEQRLDSMLAAGFISEVETLMQRGDLHPDLPSMRCVGYRQAWAYLSGAGTLSEMRDKAIFATRQLCKRQLTWLRGLPARVTVDCCSAIATETAVAHAERTLSGNC